MRRVSLRLLIILLALCAVSGLSAQDSLIAPNIFVRGMRLAQGVRYSAAFVKPSDDLVLHNVSVEVTLPQDAVFLEMLVSRQVEFDVIRRSPQKQLTLIWQISRINADQALDSFSFTVAEPLNEAVEFYMQWEDANRTLYVENFFERPLIVDASQTEQTVSFFQSGMQPFGATGIQIALPAEALPLSLTARILPTDFNPPPEYGDLWWCSLLALEGLPAGTSAQVIVPLRRPVAPFTALAIFQQQADGIWTPLASQAIVTADGQYAVYTHPGGLVATGGPEEIQQTPLTAEQVEIVEVPSEPEPAPVLPEPVQEIIVPVEPPPVEPPPLPVEPTAIPIEPTAVPIEPTAIPIEPTAVPIELTAIPIEPTAVPVESTAIAIQPSPIPPTTAPISNTVVVNPTSLPTATKKTDGVTIVGSTPIQPTQRATRTSSAPSSTPLPTRASPVATRTPSTITDGSSNTLLIGEPTRVIAPTPLSDSVAPTFTPFPTLGGTVPAVVTFTDGSSNTLLIGEATRVLAPTPLPDSVAPTFTPFPILGGTPPAVVTFTDGSSNTLIIGEATRVLAPTPLPDSVAPTSTAKTDGVITVGGVTVTPGLIVTGKGGAVVVGSVPSASPTVALLPTLGGPAPTRSGITDGSSNTLLVGELSRTPTPPPVVTRIPPTVTATSVPTLAPTSIRIAPGIIVNPPPVANPILPFGGGGTRVEILAVSNTQMTQCSAGNVNCAVIVRVVGKGKR